MKVIVMGCGRVGSQLSKLLAQRGHDVTVIDHRDADAGLRLGDDFTGRIVHGLGFDRDVLNRAGIATADAFIAASSSDNANIVAARIARNIFRVPRVVARMYDPLRAEIYQRLGVSTISGTQLGVRQIYDLVTHTDLDVLHKFGRGDVSVLAVEAGFELAGRSMRDLGIPGEVVVFSVTRDNHAFIPTNGTEFHEGDVLHLAVASTSMTRLEEMLGLEKRNEL
ncbi:MAG: TrkA family potassium uptake protein [Anaerolineales bacterium]|jgi:trk system potassium uptake protein TrkA|nr:TrkA family potassium uptake protein [Anaerolineales bacterium]